MKIFSINLIQFPLKNFFEDEYFFLETIFIFPRYILLQGIKKIATKISTGTYFISCFPQMYTLSYEYY